MSSKISIVQIPTMDTSFMDEILENGIADSGLESNGDVYYSYDNTQKEDSKERLLRFGFDMDKIDQW